MATTAHRIVVEDDLTARVPPPRGRGELALLAGQLNALLDKNSEHVRILRETLDHLAHDLRTPLTRLRGTAEIAMEGPADPKEAQHALLGVVEESDRVLHLLEALLDVSAAEGGALALHQEPVDLRVLAARAIDLYREVAEERKIAVQLEDGPAAPLVADPVRLGQAISNLVDNALKYTPSGGRVILRVEGGDPAVLRVDDTGPGVPAAEREAIWRRLYRGDASRSQRGLGLGLTLVRAIAEAHGGDATVQDAPGGGARFVLRVPRGSDPRTGV
jgi:signal transduction histidine kinase